MTANTLEISPVHPLSFLAEDTVKELLTGAYDYSATHHIRTAWGEWWMPLPDGDFLFIRVDVDELDAIYTVGPFAQFDQNERHCTDSFEKAVRLVAYALELSASPAQF